MDRYRDWRGFSRANALAALPLEDARVGGRIFGVDSGSKNITTPPSNTNPAIWRTTYRSPLGREQRTTAHREKNHERMIRGRSGTVNKGAANTDCAIRSFQGILELFVDFHLIACGQAVGFIGHSDDAINSANIASVMPLLRAAAVWEAMQ